MQELVKNLKKLHSGINFTPGESFFWSPKHQTITFNSEGDTPADEWALLHETAHALLNHKHYSSDVELLMLEVAAWQKAKELAQNFDIAIDEEHIQDCLDTYRDWLHQRSTCPRCGVVSMQISEHEYQCHNCNARWHVSTSRFCRPYRLAKGSDHIKSHLEHPSQATFQSEIDY